MTGGAAARLGFHPLWSPAFKSKGRLGTAEVFDGEAEWAWLVDLFLLGCGLSNETALQSTYGNRSAPSCLLDPMVTIMFSHAVSTWATYYESAGKHWATSRPDYVDPGYNRVIDAMIDGWPGRVGFFTALAGYLARETSSLCFLDAVAFGSGHDEDMLSWVPNSSREVSKSAYDFMARVKGDQAPDMFNITDIGGTLRIVGRSRAIKRILRLDDLHLLESSWWQGAFNKIMALSRMSDSQ